MPPQDKEPAGPQSGGVKGPPLPDPSDDDIKKYDLEIHNWAAESDREEIDYSA